MFTMAAVGFWLELLRSGAVCTEAVDDLNDEDVSTFCGVWKVL